MKIWVALLGTSLTMIGTAIADSDHDRARRAVEQGLILPLKDILVRLQQAYPGQVLKAELDDEDGIVVYELKILGGDGRVIEVVYDARTGELLKAKGGASKR
jgi:uncharacterized membrane protein YkoI